MASEPVATSDVTFERRMGNMVVSWARLSTAATLYGFAQLQASVESVQQAGRLSQQIHGLEATVNSLTACLAERISESKKGSLQSFSDVTDKLVKQSFAALSLFDPRQILLLTDRLVARSSATISDWMRKPEPEPSEEPKLAVDVLAARPELSGP